MSENPIDHKYFTAVRPGSIGERLAIAARDRIYDDFLHHCAPTNQSKILDVGVSDVPHKAANVIERRYPYPEHLTTAGLGSGDAFRQVFPTIKYVRIDVGQKLPFEDKSFDIVTSNAVLEHVSNRLEQLAFVRELQRVARQAFISVPNRFFPVEHHTALPFLHYHDSLFRWGCQLFGLSEWAEEENLILMSKKRLLSLAPPLVRVSSGYTGIKSGIFSSNLFLHLSDI